MNDYKRFSLNQAYILHSRSYRENSLILDLFTLNQGRISVIAKGVKKGKRSKMGLLQAFTPVLVSWRGKGDLYTLTNVELNGAFKYLKGINLLCAYYVNELILRFLHKEDPYEDLFTVYHELIQHFKSSVNIEFRLRYFECFMFDALGYGLNLIIDYDSGEKISSDKNYFFEVEQGPSLGQASESSIKVSGHTLLALSNNNIGDDLAKFESKKLMRYIVNYYLAGKPLKTQQLKWKYKNQIKPIKEGVVV